MSGWTFPGWRGGFYPKGLPQKQELAFAATQVTSIEINGTFYRVQKPSSFKAWYDATPKNFVFSLKAPQYVTHIRRAIDVETPIANFLASGVFLLKEKLGPLLWQFPPNLTLKDNRIEKLAALLPKTPAQAAKLAARHSDWLDASAVTSARGVKQIRHAFEFRHPSFFNKDFLQILRAHGIAIVFAHGGDPELFTQDPTAAFVYCRMHGEGRDYTKGYAPKTLRAWTKTLQSLRVPEAFVYFDTEKKKFSPQDARNFIAITGG